MTARVLGAVLAGGASSRFGSDKALAMLDGRTLLEHARAALAGMVDEVVVVGRGEVVDLPRAGLGPLGGIAGALDHAGRRGFGSVVTVACDMVRLPAGLLEALLERAPAYCADAPVLGHWPAALTTALLDRLATPFRHPGPVPGSMVPQAPTPRLSRHDGPRGKPGVTEEGNARHLRDPALSVRRWAIDIGAVAIPLPGPIANVNTPADLAAS